MSKVAAVPAAVTKPAETAKVSPPKKLDEKTKPAAAPVATDAKKEPAATPAPQKQPSAPDVKTKPAEAPKPATKVPPEVSKDKKEPDAKPAAKAPAEVPKDKKEQDTKTADKSKPESKASPAAKPTAEKPTTEEKKDEKAGPAKPAEGKENKSPTKDAPAPPKSEEPKAPPPPPVNASKKVEEPASDSDPYEYEVSDSDDEEELKKPPPMINIGVDLKSLKSALTTGDEKPAREPRQKLTDIDHAKYNKFKDKFEHLDTEMAKAGEERRKLYAEEIQGAGEQLNKFKDKFEKLHQGIEVDDPEAGEKTSIAKSEIVVERSAADKKRIMKMFKKKPGITVIEDVPKNCTICDKPVYPVERVVAEKQIWHKTCFRCSTCSKLLTVFNYNAHEHKIYCKLHLMETLHPDMVGKFDPNETADVDRAHMPRNQDDSDDEEYALVSKPKQLDKSVVRSGLKPTDDLDSLPSLSNVKNRWQQNAEQTEGGVTRRSHIDDEVLQKGAVKERMSKLVDGGSQSESDEEDNENVNGDIVKGSRKKKREQLHFETASLKSKWETGKVETAEGGKTDRNAELEELKRIGVKERFKEKTDDKEQGDRPHKELEIDTSTQEHPKQAILRFLRYRRYISTDLPVNTASPTDSQDSDKSCPENQGHQQTNEIAVSAEAMKKFKEGKPWEENQAKHGPKEEIKFGELGSFKERFEKGPQDAHPTEKQQVDVRCAELGNIKAAFEGGKFQNNEEEEFKELRREKQNEIDLEFQRFKSQLRKVELREQRDYTETAAIYNTHGFSHSSSRHSNTTVVNNYQLSPIYEHHNGYHQNTNDGAAAREDITGLAELGSIKDKFEKGDVFQSDDSKKTNAEVEIKVARKAREKFRKIDAEAPGDLPVPKSQTSAAGAKKTDKDNVPEPVNKRVMPDEDSDVEDSLDVRDLRAKFASLNQGDDKKPKGPPRAKRQITPPPEGYRAEIESEVSAPDPSIIRADAVPSYRPAAGEAKNIKARFEHAAEEAEEMNEARRKQLEEEFRQYKELKSQQPGAAEEEGDDSDEERKAQRLAELEAIANRDHAAKMAKKWEKLQAKEAKKAGKSAPSKPKAQLRFGGGATAERCFACSQRVYFAERKECGTQVCHAACFKCHTCAITLRTESYAFGPDGLLYCVNHHRQQFSGIDRPLFDGRNVFEAQLCA